MSVQAKLEGKLGGAKYFVDQVHSTWPNPPGPYYLVYCWSCDSEREMPRCDLRVAEYKGTEPMCRKCGGREVDDVTRWAYFVPDLRPPGWTDPKLRAATGGC